MRTSLPPVEWVPGVDPEGSRVYTLADPAAPGWRVVVAEWKYHPGGHGVWSADYLRSWEWWWHAPHSDPRTDAIVPRSRSLETCLRAGTLRVFGHGAFGQWVWAQLVAAGLPTDGGG